MKKLFITATNTDIGKTYTTCKLIAVYSAMGYNVGVIKPIETGVTKAPLDGSKLYETLRLHNPTLTCNIEDIVPITFILPAAPYIANEAKNIDLTPVTESIERFEAMGCDILLIEGAGGLMVPVDKDTMMIDLIEYLQCDATLLVSHDALGCISDTLVNCAFLDAKDINYIYSLNVQDMENFAHISKPYFDDALSDYLIVDRDIDKIAKQLYNCATKGD